MRAHILYSIAILGSLGYLAIGLITRPMLVVQGIPEWLLSLTFFFLLAILALIIKPKGGTIAALSVAALSGITIYSFGLAPVASVLSIFLASFALGARIRALVLRTSAASPSFLDLPLGLSVVVAILGLASHLTGLDRGILAVLLVLALFLGRHALSDSLARGSRTLASEIDALSPQEILIAALLAGTMAYVALGCFLPTVSYDDHATHLRLWTDLRYSGKALMDPAIHVWALTQFGSDLLYALPSLVAGEDTRGPVNLVLLLLIAVDLYRVSSNVATSKVLRLLAVALFVSTPLLLLATTSLQTEMWLTFFATRFLYTVLREARGPRFLYALECISLAALMAATKATGALLGALFLALSFTRVLQPADSEPIKPAWPWLLICIALAIVTALQSYVTSWAISGNPVLPLFNGIFKSPYFEPVNFYNYRYTQEASLSGFVRMFWETHRFLESHDGVAGFQYLFVAPFIGLTLLLRPIQNRRWLSLFLVVVIYTSALFSSQQYARYLLPVMPTASILLLAAFAPATPPLQAPRGFALRFHVFAAMLFCVVISAVNLNFSKGAIWYLDTPLFQKILPRERATYEAQLLPERRANEIINAHMGTRSRVLYENDRPYGATLAGTPMYSNWYNPALQHDLQSVSDAGSFERLVYRYEITHILWDTSYSGILGASVGASRRGTAEYLAANGIPLGRVGTIDIYSSSPVRKPLTKVFDLAAPEYLSLLRPKPALRVTEPDLIVNNSDRVFTATLPLTGTDVLEAKTSITCSAKAQFVVQVLWDPPTLAPHYRPVPCEPGRLHEIVDVIQVPTQARQMVLYFNSYGPVPVMIHSYRVYGH